MVVLGLLVSSCSGGDPQPRALPTLATASRTPAPTLAALPEAAKAKTPQGADAFVRYFFSQLNVAFTSGTPEMIRVLSAPSCVLCKTYADGVEAARASGDTLDADTFIIAEVAAAPLQPLGTVVQIFGSTPKRHVLDRHGVVLRDLEASGQFHYELAAKRTAIGWIVSDMREVR